MQIESRMESRKKHVPIHVGWIIVLILFIVVLSGGIGAGVYIRNILNHDTIYSGVSVNNIALGLLSMEQATAQVDKYNDNIIQAINFNLIYKGKKWTFNAKDIQVAFNTSDIMAKAYAIGRKGTIWERMKEIRQVEETKINFETSYTSSIAPLKAKVEKIAAEVSFLPVNATITFHADNIEKFTFTQEKTGLGMNVQEAMNLLQNMMEKKDFGSREIKTKILQPKVKVIELKKSTELVSTYTTILTKNKARNQNVILAVSAIHGKGLLPGQIFSMNKTTGERTTAKGYQSAPVIKDGKRLADEPGGGVCQSSGTIYNAVLLSDLEIVERYHHSWPSTYVPTGQDATIDYPSTDFKFKNDRTTPVYFARTIIGDKVTVEIYGSPLPDGQKVKVYSEVVSSTPPPPPLIKVDKILPIGKKVEIIKARIGYRVKTYKEYYDANGVKIKTRKITEDVYKPIRGEYAVGPVTPTPTPTPTPSPTPTPTPSPTPSVSPAVATNPPQ